MVGYPFRTEPTTGDGGPSSNAVTAAGGSVTADRGDKQSATTLEDAASKLALSTDDYAAKARGAGWTEKTAFDYDQYNRTGGDSHNWAGSAKKYEWKDEYGDVGPEVPELEQLLFGGEFQMRKGAHFENLDIKVTVEGPKEIVPIRKVSLLLPSLFLICDLTDIHMQFDDAGLHPVILRNVELCGYDDVTPIQSYAIPAILKGHDLVAIAETGTCLHTRFTPSPLLTTCRLRQDGRVHDSNSLSPHGQG